MNTERRASPRVPVDFLVSYDICRSSGEPSQDEKQAIALDISEGGIGLMTNFEIPAASTGHVRLRLKFDLILNNGQSHDICSLGEARYCFKVFGESKWHVGIQFVDLKEEDKEIIAAFVRSSL